MQGPGTRGFYNFAAGVFVSVLFAAAARADLYPRQVPYYNGVSCPGPHRHRARRPRRPNIVFLLADDLGIELQTNFREDFISTEKAHAHECEILANLRLKLYPTASSPIPVVSE